MENSGTRLGPPPAVLGGNGQPSTGHFAFPHFSGGGGRGLDKKMEERSRTTQQVSWCWFALTKKGQVASTIRLSRCLLAGSYVWSRAKIPQMNLHRKPTNAHGTRKYNWQTYEDRDRQTSGQTARIQPRKNWVLHNSKNLWMKWRRRAPNNSALYCCQEFWSRFAKSVVSCVTDLTWAATWYLLGESWPNYFSQILSARPIH